MDYSVLVGYSLYSHYTPIIACLHYSLSFLAMVGNWQRIKISIADCFTDRHTSNISSVQWILIFIDHSLCQSKIKLNCDLIYLSVSQTINFQWFKILK